MFCGVRLAYLEKACLVTQVDGVIVTHAEGYRGEGIEVYLGGTFIMYDGKISGNNNPHIMTGSAHWEGGHGGGVYNKGTFEMFGGEISGNTAERDGGGVHNSRGNFTMYGGKISGNTAGRYGGGVCGGDFVMFDGEISNNTAGESGGGVDTSNFTMHNGTISGNTAKQYGGGVFGTFNKLGGTISNNIALEGNDTFPPLNDDEQTAVKGYSLRSVLAICVSVIVIVVVMLFLYFKSHKTGVHSNVRKKVYSPL